MTLRSDSAQMVLLALYFVNMVVLSAVFLGFLTLTIALSDFRVGGFGLTIASAHFAGFWILTSGEISTLVKITLLMILPVASMALAANLLLGTV